MFLIKWFKNLFVSNQKVSISPVQKETTSPANTNAPWMDWMIKREGWNEANNDKELSIYWKYTNCEDFKTVVGPEHAWCKMTVNAALAETGYQYNKDASAISAKEIGTECRLTYGAIMVLEHTSGGHHVTFFSKWIDQNKLIAECFGGNQGNALCREPVNISGHVNGHDLLVASRWPTKI